jgi:hypothetical protein
MTTGLHRQVSLNLAVVVCGERVALAAFEHAGVGRLSFFEMGCPLAQV